MAGSAARFAQRMRRWAPAALLLLAGPLCAQWAAVGGTDRETLYADAQTIRRAGHMARMWHLNDFRELQSDAGIRLLSIKRRQEYDCQTRRFRGLFYSWHSKNMGAGVVVLRSADPGGWIPVASANSASDILWNIACAGHSPA